ncbi:MAG: RsmB/NOP family class I SAM-dependent RNA methyltransferase [Rhodobacteraceae bacterium]|nr:RsmB/NOP family class I SAM-dependent RNA methyltransferase [Paracoccaceae bacterium]
MTPSARLEAAIAVLGRTLAGQPAERELLRWARASRFAGAADREAVRDLVFAALRCRRSHAALGGAETGRGLILGGLREAGIDPAPLFSGARHAPPPLAAEEADHLARPPDLAPLVALDCPDWLAPELRASLGEDFAPVMAALRLRAPLFLRAGRGPGGRDGAIAALAREGISARPHPLAATALEVAARTRGIRGTAAFARGLVEVQDAASQAVVEALPAPAGAILDLCAGGGGKTLALAARFPAAAIAAHDAVPARLADLPARAARAGARVRLMGEDEPERAGPFTLVLADVPCSGSGAWRRQPEAKWRLTPAGLQDLAALQARILERAAGLVAPGGTLAYATCSLLATENEARVAAFLDRHPGWRAGPARRWSPLAGGDGFFLALLHP